MLTTLSNPQALGWYAVCPNAGNSINPAQEIMSLPARRLPPESGVGKNKNKDPGEAT